ncbi:MAG: hypothetical protein R3232_08340, partial [Clostridia bacterium]|nr:hypothetical protein [Clostridia bacterium]
PDAEGYPDELFFYARDRCGLDFCAITDNDIYGDNILTRSALRYMQSLCDCISKDGIFQAFCGFEWTYHRPGLKEPENFNHRTVIFLDDQVKIASRAEASGENEAAFSATLAGLDTMWHAHHGIWRILDPAHDANVEVVSAWANNIEEFETVHQQLDGGQVFGFMGASDNHRFIPGNGGALTGVFSHELSKGALKKAFQNRKNYATCGTRPYVYFSVNNFFMGDVANINKNNECKLYLHVKSEKTIDYIEIFCNGEVLDCIQVNKNEIVYKSKVQIMDEKSYFYAKIKLMGEVRHFPHNLAKAEGKYIYSSPIWIV